MPGTHPKLAREAVRRRYNQLLINTSDPWHDYTAKAIREQLKVWHEPLFSNRECLVLNAGSGGDDLGVCPPEAIHLDLAEQRLKDTQRAIIASVESIPLPAQSVGTIICVGSVINYCDPAAAIVEFGRIACSGAWMAVEFESSRSGELLCRRGFGSAAVVVRTFYGDSEEVVWVYRPPYIESLLSAAGFRVVERVPIHIVSPWLLLFTRLPAVASRAGELDRRFSSTSFLTRWASNHLWLCRRHGDAVT